MNHLVVIGQGYVGLPLSRAAQRAGIKVIGLDKNTSTVDSLNSGRSHIDDVSHDEVREMVELGYEATSDPGCISGASYVVLCVPTPLGDAGRPDLRSVVGASEDVAAHMTAGTVVVLESTTYPGTTEDLVLPILLQSELVLDEDFWLAFSPERIDPGNKRFGLENTPKVVGGVTPLSSEAAGSFYSQFVESIVLVRGAKEAETAKLLENTYRHINIALVNEMVKFCHELDIDLWNVIDAAATKPFGFQAFYPGPGVGGHCIPIDPSYLSFEVERSLGYPFRFVELAEEINNSMPRYVVDRVQDLLNEEAIALKGAKVLILGVTYKANIADQRESPAQPIAGILMSKGAQVSFHDPRVSSWRIENDELLRVSDLSESLSESDIVILLQNHDEYDISSFSRKAKMFFDTRGASSRDSQAHRL